MPSAAGPAQASAPDRSAVPGPGALPEGPTDPPAATAVPGAPVTAAQPTGTSDTQDAPDAPDAPGTPARKLPRAVGVALATAGLLAVTAVSATVTVAVGKPEHRPAVTAATAPATAPTTAAATASSAPPATASATPTTAPPAAPAPAPVPTPTSTLKGTVSNGRHDGDLQYFLLPIPEGGESYGPADGMLLTDKDMGEQMGGAEAIKALKSFGYKDSATRTYRTADGKAEVTVTLLRFSTPARAAEVARNYTLDGLDPVEITGDPTAHGYVDKPKQQAYTGSLSGISSQGDVQYIIDVDVKGTPDKALLSELMKRQRDWLTSGR
ncbi:hypothetical protein OG401_03920 [Kitasatospora purpeofusca]|uniref:hypothetical protein n=1 Tax=Kitasatospora purpeofusca TaxID=67352 RepID=UPI00224D6958|nr:hypothetical protein [Kitasatospora purpeofusca]MCX4683460.1 hypothetical protein [Kitasatospora purpeofusca]